MNIYCLLFVLIQVIQVTPVPGKADWFIGQRGSQRGRIPAPYVQLL